MQTSFEEMLCGCLIFPYKNEFLMNQGGSLDSIACQVNPLERKQLRQLIRKERLLLMEKNE